MVSPQLSPLQQRETASPADGGVSKSSLYSRTGYIEGESPHLPRDMDHSLGIAREEVYTHPLHDATPQYKKTTCILVLSFHI